MTDVRLPRDVAAFAQAWLGIWPCASKDRTQTTVFQMIHLAQYETGVMLSAGDMSLFAGAWVPFDPDKPDWPAKKAEPVVSIVVGDPDGMAKQALTKVMQHGRNDDGTPVTLDACTRKTRQGSRLQLFEMASTELVLTVSAGDNVIAVPISQVEFPAWREAKLKHDTAAHPMPQPPSLVKRLAQVADSFCFASGPLVTHTANDGEVLLFEIDGTGGRPSLAGFARLDTDEGDE